MDSYEYDGYTVLAVGVDADGYFVETVFGKRSLPFGTLLEAGMCMISVEELAMLHGVEEIGQVVYGISRGGNQCHCY